MNRHTAILIAGIILTLDVSLARPVAAQPALQPVFLTISNQAAVPADVLARARAEVSRIYKTIGVEVVFTDEPSAEGDHRFIVNLVPERMGHRASTFALGAALVGGTLAYVVFERVECFAQIWDNSVPITLGHTLAHELGHLLLQDGSHSAYGLMRDKWDLDDARLASVGRLLFTSREAARIRHRLAIRQ